MATQTQKKTSVLAKIQSADVKSQEKYGFTVRDGQQDIPFGPFDTREAAGATAKALTASGLTVSDVTVIWTVATARNLAAALRAAQPKEEGKTEAAKTA